MTGFSLTTFLRDSTSPSPTCDHQKKYCALSCRRRAMISGCPNSFRQMSQQVCLLCCSIQKPRWHPLSIPAMAVSYWKGLTPPQVTWLSPSCGCFKLYGLGNGRNMTGTWCHLALAVQGISIKPRKLTPLLAVEQEVAVQPSPGESCSGYRGIYKNTILECRSRPKPDKRLQHGVSEALPNEPAASNAYRSAGAHIQRSSAGH